MEAARHLRPVPDGINQTEVARGVRKAELLVIDRETGEPVTTAADTIAGLLRTIEAQSRTIGSLERTVREDGDLTSDPKGSEIQALFARWQRATGRTTTKLGKPRVKMVRARLRDGYPLTSEEWLPTEPTLELAIDGLAAFPYRVFNRRQREGKPSDLDNGFERALQDERHVEELSRLGFMARKQNLVTWNDPKEDD